MKKFFFVYAWLFLTAGVILTSIATYQFFFRHQKQDEMASENQDVSVLAATDEIVFDQEQNTGVQSMAATNDAREVLLARFLERHNSPLEPYDHFAHVFVDIADRHGFDFRLLPAIAMQESNLCKNIPHGSYNCLGFGIHERGTLAFDNFESNFERAGRELKANYIDIGLTTPEDIMTKYTPYSDGSWADSVNQWMIEIRYNDRELGREIDQNSSVLEFVEEKE